MANLEQIKKLNEEYGKTSPIRSYTKTFAINEAIDKDNIKKAINDSIAVMGPEYSRYFDFGLPAEAVLMFIDVCDFSTRFDHFNGEQISEFFDKYYDLIIPIIYEHGGEIDKIIGDGIVCLFAPPFQDEDLLFNIEKANLCAKKIIKSTKGTEFSSKVAIHSGEINYFKNKSGLYNEFTVIGKPLTELFRLESISINDRVNYFDDTEIRKFYDGRFTMDGDSSPTCIIPWTHIGSLINDLKGVEYKQFFSIRYNKK